MSLPCTVYPPRASVLPGVPFRTTCYRPTRERRIFICPSVSVHTLNGNWVIWAQGDYVIVPTKGGAFENSKVFLIVPVSVPDKAQIPAGCGLYKDLPTFPNFEGMVVLLVEVIDTWLGSPAGWETFDDAYVMDNVDGSTYTVKNMGLMMDPIDKGSVTISKPIPLASTAVW